MKFPDLWFTNKYKQHGDFEGDSREAALKYVTDNWCAVDGGAHCGIWTDRLCRVFSHVVAFEPHPENYQYLIDNVQRTNLTTYQYALGEEIGSAGMEPGPDDDPNLNSGQWHLSNVCGAIDVQVSPLDAFNLYNVGFIKLDVEGYEYFALKGAEKTIKKWRPVVLIEENGLCNRYGIKDGQCGELLKSWGYSLAQRVRKDEIWTP